MKISCKHEILLYALLVLPELLFGRLLLEHSDIETPDKDTNLHSFEFTLSENNSRMVLDLVPVRLRLYSLDFLKSALLPWSFQVFQEAAIL